MVCTSDGGEGIFIFIIYFIVYVPLRDYLRNVTPSVDLGALASDCHKTKATIQDYNVIVGNYATCLLGCHWLELFFKENLEKSIIDTLTVSDEAFMIIILENDWDKWVDEAQRYQKADKDGANLDVLDHQENEQEQEGNTYRENHDDTTDTASAASSVPKKKKAKWTKALTRRKNVQYVDNWTQVGKDWYKKVGRCLAKITWHDINKKTIIYPTPKKHLANVDKLTIKMSTVWPTQHLCCQNYPSLQLVNMIVGKYFNSRFVMYY